MIILAQVVKERESIRTLCDKLRRERDRAVSELAEALRDLDEVKKNRNEVGIFTHPHPFDWILFTFIHSYQFLFINFHPFSSATIRKLLDKPFIRHLTWYRKCKCDCGRPDPVLAMMMQSMLMPTRAGKSKSLIRWKRLKGGKRRKRRIWFTIRLLAKK